ncbi:hypothetical protein TNCV_4156231 [Trichonephila clavipes]|nr:hypothetical protein TNCV_4156231 [Trichonephila clavipes]
MSNGSWNTACAVCSPFNKVAAMPEDTIANAIFLWSYFRKAAPENLVAIWNKNTDEALVPHPEMHLVPTFDACDPASYVPEGTGSTIVRQSYGALNYATNYN